MRGSKYDPLRDHLAMQRRNSEVTLTFKEIERALGFQLCRSADRPQWWSNVKGETSHVQRNAWRAAGYDAFLLPRASSVRFVRVDP